MSLQDTVSELYRNITDVPGILMGHVSDYEALTGCTAVLCPEGAVGGVEVRGASPGTRETDLLRPGYRVEEVHAVILAGGSAFGLDAACGAVRYLEEQGYGFDTGIVRVPIVPAAIIFDLSIGNKDVRPDAKMGYDACTAACAGKQPEGCVGAGTGALVGNMLGPGSATKSGLGSWSLKQGDLIVGSVVVVNALGDVVDPVTGKIIAGLRHPQNQGFLDSSELILRGSTERIPRAPTQCWGWWLLMHPSPRCRQDGWLHRHPWDWPAPSGRLIPAMMGTPSSPCPVGLYRHTLIS